VTIIGAQIEKVYFSYSSAIDAFADEVRDTIEEWAYMTGWNISILAGGCKPTASGDIEVVR
jgi:hypothetical protein